MGFFVVMMIMLGLVILFGIIVVFAEDANGIWVIGVGCLLMWLTFESKTVRYAKPIAIPHSELSIMSDSEMAIVRYGDEIFEYTEVKEYNAIKDSNFVLMITKEYNILGDRSGEEFELIIKKPNGN